MSDEIRHHMRRVMDNDHPEDASALAEQTAIDLGFEEWINDLDHEIWDIAVEFFCPEDECDISK